MASIVRPADAWDRFATPPVVQLRHEEPEWEFRELEYGPGGTWDVVTARLHVASHLDSLRQRLGSPKASFRPVPPSAAISAPGDHLSGAWEGRGRGQHLIVSPGFVAAAFARDMGAETVLKRHFAYQRDPDATDTIIQNLLGCIAADLRRGSPNGSVFLQTVVLAIVQHALRVPSPAFDAGRSRGGLSRAQLSLVIDLIDARLTARPSLVDLASALGISTRYFCHAFRVSTGLSPHRFIIERRVALARSLIERGDLPLSEVAQASGFTDHSQMSATFRKVLGVPPSHFRHRRTRSR
ncbi:helix-turn-helix transcriptional regulator [Methylobacterium oryzisoli]|uniref:helix-turn-helix transcriptional regulator n=1 Tax=Methylobacterium oryzisoli TaxID=3385502 RepID=UPI003891296B